MIKKTIYIGNTAQCCLSNNQLQITNEQGKHTIPLEDIGFLILDSAPITVTQALLQSCLQHNIAVIICDEKHQPDGLLLTTNAHTQHNLVARMQIAATKPLQKNLWTQIIEQKILNQALHLKKQRIEYAYLKTISTKVRSGDSTNQEARAAAYYWKALMGKQFIRDRYGDVPNHAFNYAYAILRAITARALVASGLLTVWGIHHRNQYNAFCLADDIMEPYRPMADYWALQTPDIHPENFNLDKHQKQHLLQLSHIDVEINEKRHPLMIGVQLTAQSLAKVYRNEIRKLHVPTMV